MVNIYSALDIYGVRVVDCGPSRILLISRIYSLRSGEFNGVALILGHIFAARKLGGRGLIILAAFSRVPVYSQIIPKGFHHFGDYIMNCSLEPLVAPSLKTILVWFVALHEVFDEKSVTCEIWI